MLKKSNQQIDILLIQIFIFLVPFAYGLFYEFTTYFSQVIILIILVEKIIKNKEIKLYANISTISLVSISLGYLITSIYAIDKRRSDTRILKIYSAINICYFNNAI